MRLVCVDKIPGRLTLGKEYDVVGSSDGYVWVVSDDGMTRSYLVKRFASRSDLRAEALSSIGI